MIKSLSDRKNDHIRLTDSSQVGVDLNDQRFDYEPLFSSHPKEMDLSTHFLNWKLKAPIWISSMTGGSKESSQINENLARVAGEFGLGMGLGSCRPLLNDTSLIKEYSVKHLMRDFPLFANLGVAQVDEIINNKRLDDLKRLVDDLSVDGLIMHINPLQEWIQPEGDRYSRSSLEVIDELLSQIDFPLIVKEVGQGFGPSSLLALMERDLAAIEFGAFGGTNFSKLERKRSGDESLKVLENIGHSANDMVLNVNKVLKTGNNNIKCGQFIISGGVKTFLDGHYLCEKIEAHAIYGQANAFLKYASSSYDELANYVDKQIKGLAFAKSFLKLKKD